MALQNKNSKNNNFCTDYGIKQLELKPPPPLLKNRGFFLVFYLWLIIFIFVNSGSMVFNRNSGSITGS